MKSRTSGTVTFGPNTKRWIETLPMVAFWDGTPTVSPPTCNPAKVYPVLEEISSHLFQIPATGLTPEQHKSAMEQMRQYHVRQRSRFLGYQANQGGFSHLEGLADNLQFQLNNLGDPFTEGNFTLNSKWLERAVLDYYASLWNARWPHDRRDPESYWGYVLSMGSTEGNLYGLWNAREYLSGKALMDDPEAEEEARNASLDGIPRKVQQRLVVARATPQEDPNMFTPVIFFSEDTHYSIHKAVRALRIKTFSEIGSQGFPHENPLEPGKPWPKEVPSKGGDGGPGSIDIEALARLVEFFAARKYPILIFFNYGTTFKGAYDDVEAAGNALMPIFRRYGLVEREVVPDPSFKAPPEKRSGFWFHVDGALGAAYMPFLEMAHNAERIRYRGPNFDFRLPYVNSIVMSGHKWIGAPWPCGIYMTKTKFQMKPPEIPEYVGTPDTTFAGSRNGFSAMLLWNYAATTSFEAQISRALSTEERAVYAHDRLRELEDRRQEDLWVARTSPCSLTIRFKAASTEIQQKYSLSGETLYVHGVKRQYSHIFLMPHVDEKLIDALVADLASRHAIPSQSEALAFEAAEEEVLSYLSVKLHEIVGDDVWIDARTSSLHFRSPNPEITSHYHLATETLFVRGRKRQYVRLENINKMDGRAVEEFLKVLELPDAFLSDEVDPETEQEGPSVNRRSYVYFAHMGRGFR